LISEISSTIDEIHDSAEVEVEVEVEEDKETKGDAERPW